MSEPYLIDRSRISAYFNCPRAYFWQYEYLNHGLAPTKTPSPLVIGGSIHKGLETLLRGGSEQTSVDAGIACLRDSLASGGLELEPQEDVLFVYKEQESLVEGLVRVYARIGAPRLLEQYEIVEIEEEYDLPLSDRVTFMSRADGLLRKRTDGRLYLLSFKTAKRYEKRLSSDGFADVQGLSEAAAIEPLIGEEIAGVQMEYLIKGARMASPEGTVIQQNLLVHPWLNEGAIGSSVRDPANWAWSYRWKDAVGGHALGKAWKRVNVWEYMSIADWVSLLQSNDVQANCGSALDTVLISPVPYFRRTEELKDWRDQTRAVGERLANYRDNVGGLPNREKLNEFYPQNRRACNWPSKCPMQDICFGPCGETPEETGLYKFREAHHETEMEKFAEE